LLSFATSRAPMPPACLPGAASVMGAFPNRLALAAPVWALALPIMALNLSLLARAVER
jgi:hypothetical protein